MGCGASKQPQGAGPAAEQALDPDSTAVLAKETYFTAAEVESLRELYEKLSNELHKDSLIHKDEFMWALFKHNKNSLFADRMFELFDIKQNNVIEFGEFVRSLSVFHPKAPLHAKAAFAFRVYDIGGTGAIERPELKRFLVALMADNPGVDLDERALDEILDETFAEMDLAKDGRINPEEWDLLVSRNPGIVTFMTLPVLTQLCERYPSSPRNGASRRL